MSTVSSGHVRNQVPDVAFRAMSGRGAEVVSSVVDSLPLVTPVHSRHVRNQVPDMARQDMSARPGVES